MKIIFHKIWGAAKSLFYYKNFLTVWRDYLSLYNNDYLIVSLFNGVRYKARSRKITVGDLYIINENWLYGVHNGIKPIVKKALVGIDIGAHIGVFSVLAAARNPILKIYAYEPAPANFKLLKENISLNRFNDRVIPFTTAVAGRREKNRRLYLTGKEGGLNTINPSYLKAIKSIERYHLKDEDISSIKVKCVTLEDIFNDNKISFCDFLKMDCEGAEYEILINSPAELFKRIGAMSIEYHLGYDVKELKKFLEQQGFLVSFPHRRLEVLLARRAPLLSKSKEL